MAIAERVPTGETFIEMTLTEDEARTLWAVCQCIGGTPEGPRGDMDSISDALTEAGVPQVDEPPVVTSGSIHLRS